MAIRNANNMTERDWRSLVESNFAVLGEDNTLPDENVTGQVTDVLEFASGDSFPDVGDPLKYYRSNATGKTYKWDTETEAYAEVVIPSAMVTSVAGKTGAVTLDKSDVGLGNVANTGDSATPVEGGTTKFTTGGAYTELAKKADLAVPSAANNVALLSATGNLADSGKAIDTTVTTDSANLVTSGAVATAIGNIDVTSQIKGKLDSDGQAATYASGTAYSVDEIVRYEGNLYRCKVAHTGGDTFDTSKWTQLKLSSDFLTIVKLTNGAETMGSIASRLGTINSSAQSQHVLFDVGAVVTTPQLYLCTIFIDTVSGALRLADQVTGKLYVGTYDSAETLSQVISKAVDSYVSLTVTAVTLDNVTVTGQTVNLYEGDGAVAARLKQTMAYEGQPVTFTVPRGFEYFVTITSTLANHFSPSTAHGSANAATSVTLTYQDTSHITTFAGLQGFLASVEADETLVSDAARVAFVEAALLPGTSADSDVSSRKAALEIADTWVDNNGTTSYSNPMVVMAAGYFEEAPADFDATETYAVNDRVLYKGISYTCSVAKSTASATPPPEDMYTGTSGHWTVTANDAAPLTKHLGVKLARKWCTVGFQFDAVETAVLCDSTQETTVEAGMGYYGWAKAFDSSAAYSVGAYCSYGGTAYKCTAAIAAGEAADTPNNDTAHWILQADKVDRALVLLSSTTYPAGASLPYSDYLAIYKNGVRDSSREIFRLGYNNYERSGVRQYLNTDGAADTWWTADHVGDVKPSQATTWRGYMAGCSEGLLAAVKKVKVTTARNTVTDGGSYRATYDTFFLPSGTELYGSVNGNEGTADLYWRQATGLTSASNSINAGRIHYRQSNHTATTAWLRSPSDNLSHNAWYCTYSGEISPNYYANYGVAASCGLAPACVIY